MDFQLNSAYAWSHELSLGYGINREVNETYDNQGFFLYGTLYKFKPVDHYLDFMVDASLGGFKAGTPENKWLQTAALSLGLREYFVPIESGQTHPYFLVTFGPSYLSEKKFGNNTQAKNVAFQTTFGAGVETTIKKHEVDFNCRLIHYCNAGLWAPNEGTDIFVFSIGYLF